MQSEAEAVVIGAGALGLSAGYHLAAMGLRRVLVLDRHSPASQTSPRAAGLFKLIQSDEARTRLATLSVQIVTHFAAETGVPLPVAHSGSIMLARTPQHAALIRSEVEQSRSWGVALDLLDGPAAHRLMPYLEADAILAACHTPGDVYIEEPASLLQAYQQAGARLGMAVLGHTAVTGIRVEHGAIAGVSTTRGEVRTPVVVDAAGAWARAVGDLARARVLVAPVRHQLYITGPIGGMQETYPILRIIDSAVYVRPCRGGLMLGGFEADPLPLDPRTADSDFSMDQVPLDMAVLARLERTVEDQVPALRGATIAEHRGGLFTMTPDGQLIVGPLPEVRGLWAATGCNGSGFSLSAGIGRVLAEWITTGSPSVDLSGLAPARFAGRALDDAALRAMGTWQYAHYYDAGQQPGETTTTYPDGTVKIKGIKD